MIEAHDHQRRGMIDLPVDRAIYAVDRATRTYRYARRNPGWTRLDPAQNQANKRSLDGYTRLFPDGRTRVFAYRPPAGHPHTVVRRDARASEPPLEALHREVLAIATIAEQLPDAPTPGSEWGPREVLAHLAFWHEHYVRTIAAMLEGQRPPLQQGSFGELNRLAVTRCGGRPNRDLVHSLMASQADLERLAQRPGAAGLAIVIKEGGKAWPIDEFLRRVTGHLMGHRVRLRRARSAG